MPAGGWANPENRPHWAKEVPVTAPPPDMEAFLKNPPKPPQSCPQGSTLWLMSRKLDDRCAEVFARTLMRGDWKHLTYLNMEGNDFTPKGVAMILKAIGCGTMPLINNLTLNRNNVGDEGLTALGKALSAMPVLSNLSCVEVQGGDIGFCSVCDAFAEGSNKKLQSMYWNGNEISNAGMEALCDAFRSGNLPKFFLFYMNGNKVEDEGLLAFANAIEEGHFDHVRTWYMMQTPSSRDGFEVVNEVVKEYDKKISIFF